MSDYFFAIDLLIILDAFMILCGLIWPWWVLWFMYRQNRLMVLQYYGTLMVFLLITRMVIKW